MKTAHKIYTCILVIVYLFSFLYIPVSDFDNTETSEDTSLLAEKAKAQSNTFFDPNMKLTQSYRNFAPTQYSGFTKIGSIKDNSNNDRVIAVGFGSLWLFDNANNSWIN